MLSVRVLRGYCEYVLSVLKCVCVSFRVLGVFACRMRRVYEGEERDEMIG